MSDHQNGAGQRKETNWGVMALMTGATSAWLIYDMASASEAPSRALMLLQYVLLACALIGLAGALLSSCHRTKAAGRADCRRGNPAGSRPPRPAKQAPAP